MWEVLDSVERRSYVEVITEYAPALLRLAVMLTGDRNNAEDLLQSTLLNGLRHGDRIAAMAAPAAYLRKVMVNEHLATGRRMSRRPRTIQLSDSWEPAQPDSTGIVEQRDEAWGWLATLGAEQRAVLVLRFYEDLPDREIAELLGCAEATVRSHAFRGLTALRARLTGSTIGMDER